MSSEPTSTQFATNLSPAPLFGIHKIDGGYRFTLWCRHADEIDLLLFQNPDDLRPTREIHLSPDEHRYGDVWSVNVPGVKAGMCYVYRITREDFPFAESDKLPQEQWVLDPYAAAIAGSREWGRSLRRRPDTPLYTGLVFPKGVIVEDDFDWEGDRPLNIPTKDLVLYETHIRGYTAHPDSGVKSPGTYSGLIEKIPHIKALGINAIELLPIYEFDEMEYFHTNDKRAELRNFWGYSTLGFFAPMSRYAAAGNRGGQVRELKELVKACHQAGIEVILDVVYNHTAEGGLGGPAYHMKSLDPDVYYIRDDQHHYHNYSGCGNTMNCNHPVVQDFILDSLRHWVSEYHIDGFRFDLASILARGRNGHLLPHPPLVERIDEDPVLQGTKMIAEAWDAAGAYQVGSFPSDKWSEWNGRYRDDIRRFWLGHAGNLSSFATRVTGSEDLYSPFKLGPAKSINFITCHDGFTLRDLVSYADKHNEANLENNRDGDNHNLSCNWGVEGDTIEHDIRALRIQMQKNFLATLFMSQGVPMMLAGDELNRTQRGSNNAYCQDNMISWVNWGKNPESKELTKFTKKLIALRKRFPVLRRDTFIGKGEADEVTHRLRWIGIDNKNPDWALHTAIGCQIHGAGPNAGKDECGDDLLIFANAGAEPVKFYMPDTDRFKWSMRLYTTSKRVHRNNLGTVFNAAPHSFVVFSAPDPKWTEHPVKEEPKEEKKADSEPEKSQGK